MTRGVPIFMTWQRYYALYILSLSLYFYHAEVNYNRRRVYGFQWRLFVPLSVCLFYCAQRGKRLKLYITEDVGDIL